MSNADLYIMYASLGRNGGKISLWCDVVDNERVGTKEKKLLMIHKSVKKLTMKQKLLLVSFKAFMGRIIRPVSYVFGDA